MFNRSSKQAESPQGDLDDQQHANVVKEAVVLNKPVVGFFSFLLKVLAFGMVVFYTTNQFVINNLWTLILSVFIVSLPIILCGIYSSTIRQIRRLAIFKEKGLIFKVVSSRVLKSVVWVLWAVGTSFFMLIQFHTYNALEWLVFLLVIPFFWIVFIACQKFTAREIVSYLATDIALKWTRALCPLIMLLIYFALFAQFENRPQYIAIPDAIDAQKIRIEDLAGSAITREASEYLALYDGIKAYVLSYPGAQDDFVGFALLAIGKLVIFFNACAILSCFVIPRTEYRRILGPLSDAEIPSPLSTYRIAAVSAMVTFVVIFVYSPIFIYLEVWLQQKSVQMDGDRKKIEKIAIDLIGDELFKKGTIEKLHKAKLEALPDIGAIQLELEEKLDLGFKRVESRVDSYLDWYYSLMGEYTRISKLLIGQLEEDMKRRFQEAIEQEGNPFWEYEAAVNSLLSMHDEAQKAYIEKANKIMLKNRFEPTDATFVIHDQISITDAFNLPIHQEDFINLQQRLGSGSAAGMVTGIIVGKVAGKSIFKLAASVLLKTVASKAAGAAVSAGAGAAAGAAIGSVAPGIGTAIGAVVGGIAGGLAAGIAVDKTLIELEEVISREKFRNEILLAINEARIEFKEKLNR